MYNGEVAPIVTDEEPFMPSVLAVDLDDTLVRSDQTVSARTLDLLAAWVDDGRRAVIATGRPPRATRAIPDALHALPWICYNGAIILDAGTTLHRTTVTGADTTAFVEAYLEAAPDDWIGLEIDEELFVVNHHDTPYNEFATVGDVRAVAHLPTHKIIVALDSYQRVASRLMPLPRGIQAQLSAKYNLAQFMAVGVSKSAALQMLVKRWGLDMADVIAFGDDVNDLEMIRDAGVGVAMANAVPELKAVANRVTLSNDEDGVALVVEELLAA